MWSKSTQHRFGQRWLVYVTKGDEDHPRRWYVEVHTPFYHGWYDERFGGFTYHSSHGSDRRFKAMAILDAIREVKRGDDTCDC